LDRLAQGRYFHGGIVAIDHRRLRGQILQMVENRR